ncbi:MAG: chemotaxis protein [Clostridium sp.]|nr:chemotaxis protein [Clostridium sp.]
MKQGKTIHTAVPREVFGIKIEGNIVPIFDDGKVVGCITCVYSLEKLDALENSNHLMKDMIKESDDSIEHILSSSTNTVNELKEVNNFVNTLSQNLEDVYLVVDSIKGNATRTKMLALNASIEASRAGEEGKGFKIVASEMSKLSQMSTESVTNINSSLNNISKSIKNVTDSIDEINSSALKNLDLVETISKNLSTMYNNINNSK